MRRRVTFVITSLFRGGAETQLVRLATALAAKDWRVEICTIIPRNDFVDEVAEAGVTVRSLGLRRGEYNPLALTRLVRMLKESRPDIVCTFMFHANVLGRVAARVARVPVVVSSVRNAVFGPKWADLLMRWTNRLANVTTTNSVLAGKELVARGVVTLERLQVIPNAIAVNSLRVRKEGESGELAKVETTWTWLAVGRLERQKAFDVALRAVDILTRSGRSLNLLIAGEGGEEHNLRDLCDQLGLGGKVDLLGYRNDVHDLLSSADAFLLSSRWEGLPNVVMEAMAAGVPVVATDVGGVRELIVDGVSGHIAPANDAAALAAAMARLMDATAEELNGFVESGHAHISEMFAPEAVFERWESLFVTLATES